MSFRKGLNKSSWAAPSSQTSSKGSLSLGGFSFKKLEKEEEEEEDLTAYTGKYEKIVEESQKAQVQKRISERTPSTSSVSSTSSLNADSKPTDRIESDAVLLEESASHLPVRMSSSLPTDSIEEKPSPIRNAARAKLESSKELFSGLKGKITDKISRTIEEFSGDSSSSPSPEHEKIKPVTVHKSNSSDTIIKETATILHSAVPVEDHPLARTEGEDEDVTDFLDADVDETSVDTLTESGNDDKQMFLDPQDNGEDPSNMLVIEEHFMSEPMEDFTGTPRFSTSTQMKPRSKIKRLMQKNEPKTSAVATMSAIVLTPDEEIAASMRTAQSKENNEQSKTNSELSGGEKMNSESTKSVNESKSSSLLRQLAFEEPLPVQKLVAVIVAVFAYLVVPLPSYLSGFVMGVALSSLGWSLYTWLMQPLPPLAPLVLPPLDQPLPVPEMKLTTETEEGLYKGWMNELTDYNVDDYHINKTHSIFISLEGTHLRIQRPKNPAPKRAMWDEVIPKAQFIHQRHFDLPGSKVFLLPTGLVKKRIWSKKYPICIALAQSSLSKTVSEENKIRHASSESVMDTKLQKDKTDMGFEIVSEEKCEHNVLFLFARTGREKEEWFKRLSAAAAGKPLGNHVLEMKRTVANGSKPQRRGSENSMRHRREGSADSLGSASSQPDLSTDSSSTSTATPAAAESVDLLSFAHYMGRLMPAGGLSSRVSSPSHSVTSKEPFNKSTTNAREPQKSGPGAKESEEPKPVNPSGPIVCDNQLFWVNALIGRCFFDFLRDKWWIGKVTEKLQRKLSKIRVPYVIEELQVTSIEMGYEIPAIRNAGRPYMDERGFWIDLDVTYTGGFKMTIETKMNLMKLKKTHHTSLVGTETSVDSTKSPVTDSDEEDSAESSTDEEEEAMLANEESSASGGGVSKKFMRYLSNITDSWYFQQATEFKMIRRAMENVSNTPLTLTVTVNSLVGKLALNIPPPPSDRLWYGFRGNPQLYLSAKPQVGERRLTNTHITEFIQKKLRIEFQRVFVMPNMDDLVIPILVPGDINGTFIPRSASL